MKKLIGLIAVLVLVSLMVSCAEPEPGEISVRTYKSGQLQNCTTELWTTGESSKQLMEAAGQNALTYLKNVTPNSYILKFKDYDGNYYEAQYAVTLSGGGSEFCEIELTEPDGIPKT